MKKKYIFYVFLGFQLLIIGILLKDIYKKHILGTASIEIIDADSIVSTKTTELKHFYEPKPNTIQKPDPIFPGLETVSYHINKAGFNQLSDYPKEKKEGVYRILTIGDSFTFGSKVNTKDNYPSQLEHILNTKLSCSGIERFEVLNLGVGGYDIQYTLERVKLRGVAYHPDLLLWLLIGDDFTRLNEFFIPRYKKYITEAKTNDIEPQIVENGMYDIDWNRAKNEAITELGGYNAVFSLQQKYMKDLNRYYTGNVVIGLLPKILDEKNHLSVHTTFLHHFSKTRKNTYFFNSLPYLYEDSQYYLPDYHPSTKGHTILADSFLKYLIQNHIIPCSIK